MSLRSRKLASVCVPAFSLSLGLAQSAYALPELPVQNLTFSDFGGNAPKDYFNSVDPADWSRGTPGANGDLVFIDAPDTATTKGGGSNSYAVYGAFANPPPGGNFVQADGNPLYESTFNQVISGLTITQQYSLSFWQAAGQQTGFSGETHEQWVVAFGQNGLTVNITGSGGTGTGVYSDPGAQINTSNLMDTASQGVSAWEMVSMTFTATATSEVLSFLAWGDTGSTANMPPTVFLAGVNSPALPAPEPVSLSLFGVGLAGLGGVMRRRRAKRDTAV